MKKKGFTLTELLIVIIIIGVLLAIILPNAFRAIQSARIDAHNSHFRTIQEAALVCFTDRRIWGDCNEVTKLEAAAERYLETTPASPFLGTYDMDVNETTGIITVTHSGGTSVPTTDGALLAFPPAQAVD